MRTSRKHSADRRKKNAGQAVLRAIQNIEGLESRLLFAAALPTTVYLTAPSPSTYVAGSGAPGVTLSASVVITGGGTPTAGTLSFFSNGVLVGSGTLTNGNVTLTDIENLPVGTDHITADYTGNSAYQSSSSTTPEIETVTGSGTTTITTTTALVSSSPTAAAGTNVTFTATVTPASNGSASPSGTVTFTSDGSTLGTISLDTTTGTAALSTSTLAVGGHTVSAVYGGDSNYSASSSNTVTETITSSGTTPSNTTISSATPTTITFGTSFTVNATVAPSGATGTVQFFSNGISLGTQTVASGAASLTTTSLPTGADSITAVYSGDGNYATSTSNAIAETVNPGALASTTTTVASSAPTITAGAPVTFTATVAPSGATGTMQFFANGNALGAPQNLSGGVAHLVNPALGAGSYTITATYSGDGNFAGSSSNSITETVNPAALISTTTAVATSAPTITAGSPVTFTATVAPGAATGTVQFLANGTALGAPQPVSGGVATLVNPGLGVGVYTITATYSGDGTYATSTGTMPGSETVTAPISPTTTTLTASTMTPTAGTIATFTASVSPGTATGTVQFFDGATALGAPVTLSGGSAVLNVASLIVGAHTITATYNGDAADSPSTSNAVIVTVSLGTAVLTPSSSAPTIALGDSVTFTATVAPAAIGGPIPTGTVTFFDGTTAISSAITLANGVATFLDPSLLVGSHSISFTYTGDTNYSPGTSSALIETVGTGPTTTTLTASPNPIQFGNSTILTATVSPSVATGIVTFFDGTTVLGTGVVEAGVAEIAIASLPTGTNGLTAMYSGDSNYSPSTSNSVTETVKRAPSNTVLTTDVSTLALGNSVTLTAAVPEAGASGTVSFYNNNNGNTLIGTATLVGGMAAITTTTLPVGSANLTAVYSGDTNYLASTSPVVAVSVTQGTTDTTVTADPTVVAVGGPVTFTVSVAAVVLGNPTPTGTVTLTEDGSTVLASGIALVNGTATFTTTTLALGVDTIVATYSGDSSFLGSASAPASVGVAAVTTQTSQTSLTSTSQSLNYGDSVTFTAVVASVLTSTFTPTGTVTFYDGTIPLGAPINLSSGIAFFTTSSLPPGINSVTAVYNGDTNFTPSTSAPVNETVLGSANNGAYVTTLDVSEFNAAFGSPVTLTASVYPSLAGTPPAFGGTVTFFSGSQTLGAATLGANEIATFATPLPAGTDEITAAYNGGGPITASLPRMVAISSPATPSLAKANLPPAIVVGTAFHTNLPIVVTNLGASQLRGLYTIQVYLDTAPTLDANRVLLTTISRSFLLNGGKGRTFHAPETLASGLPAGKYYLLVDVTDPHGLTNLTASKPIVIAQPFVGLSAAVSATNPPNIAIGQSAAVFVTLTNTGNEVASGLLSLTLSPSTDGINSVAGKILGTGSITTTILPGKSKRFRVMLDTTALATGSYFPYVAVSLAGVSTTSVGITPFTVG